VWLLVLLFYRVVSGAAIDVMTVHANTHGQPRCCSE
jgi:hypothetical protein